MPAKKELILAYAADLNSQAKLSEVSFVSDILGSVGYLVLLCILWFHLQAHVSCSNIAVNGRNRSTRIAPDIQYPLGVLEAEDFLASLAL